MVPRPRAVRIQFLMRILTSIFTTQRWTFDIKKNLDVCLRQLCRIKFFMRIPTLYFVPGTIYNSYSQPSNVFLLDVGNLFLPFDFVPDILGGFDGDAVPWLHQLDEISTCRRFGANEGRT